MRLNDLKLHNFRNYENLELSFDPGVNLIVGNNAQGKTNMLEAVSFLGSGKSFRTQKSGEMVKLGADFALDPSDTDFNQKVLEITDKVIAENNLTTLMVTHNMRDAIAHGNRLIMLHEGRVVVDVEGDEKALLTVEDLLALKEALEARVNEMLPVTCQLLGRRENAEVESGFLI